MGDVPPAPLPQACKLVMVLGISGVGKTTMIDRFLSSNAAFLGLSASQILADARRVRDKDFLRRLPMDELTKNQELLLAGFHRLTATISEQAIILDAHAVIDADTQLFEVRKSVFEELAPKGLIHIVDDPEKIYERRGKDSLKQRPQRSVQALREHQVRSVELASSYASSMKVRFIQVAAGDHIKFGIAVESILDQ